MPYILHNLSLWYGQVLIDFCPGTQELNVVSCVNKWDTGMGDTGGRVLGRISRNDNFKLCANCFKRYDRPSELDLLGSLNLVDIVNPSVKVRGWQNFIPFCFQLTNLTEIQS